MGLFISGCAASDISPMNGDRLSGWSCPAAGTIVSWETSKGRRGSDQSEGPDPADPTICRWTTNGVTTSHYYSVRAVAATKWTEDERSGFLNAMRTFFDGQSDVVGFTDRQNNQQVSHIWRIAGKQPVDIGGETVTAIRISTHNVFSGNGASWRFDRWLDADRHLWLKTYDPGTQTEWRVISIQRPS